MTENKVNNAQHSGKFEQGRSSRRLPMVNFAAADVDGLVRIVKRKLKKIQYRPT